MTYYDSLLRHHGLTREQVAEYGLTRNDLDSEYIPLPDEIAAKTAEIREGWSDARLRAASDYVESPAKIPLWPFFEQIAASPGGVKGRD